MRTSEETVRLALALAIGVVWFASVIVELATLGHYHVSLTVHGLMGTVVGSLFAGNKLKKVRREAAEKLRPEDDD